jgi:transcriptional regulator GlxA family with amidase domain
MGTIHKVVVLVQDGVEPFGLGSMCEVWGENYHPEDDAPVFDFHVVTPRPGRVRGSKAFDLHVDEGLEHLGDADLICIAPRSGFREPEPVVSDALVRAHDRGAYLLAHCSAAFELAHAGLLDGREATTHWRYAEEMAQRFPEVTVTPDVLYVSSDRIVTGAGSAAGLDASLHLMREVFGARVAGVTARRMVVPPHRDGGQSQFIKQPVPECDSVTFAPLVTWIAEHLDDDLSVDVLARRMSMSPRTFARRFVAETGATPHGFVTAQRVRRTEEYLEQSDLSIEQIATRVGFSSAATLRHQFTRARGLSPSDYRRRFSATVA